MECWLRAKCTFWSMMITHCWSYARLLFRIYMCVCFFFFEGKTSSKKERTTNRWWWSMLSRSLFGVCMWKADARYRENVQLKWKYNETAVIHLFSLCFDTLTYGHWITKPFLELLRYRHYGCFLFTLCVFLSNSLSLIFAPNMMNKIR